MVEEKVFLNLRKFFPTLDIKTGLINSGLDRGWKKYIEVKIPNTITSLCIVFHFNNTADIIFENGKIIHFEVELTEIIPLLKLSIIRLAS